MHALRWLAGLLACYVINAMVPTVCAVYYALLEKSECSKDDFLMDAIFMSPQTSQGCERQFCAGSIPDISSEVVLLYNAGPKRSTSFPKAVSAPGVLWSTSSTTCLARSKVIECISTVL